MFGWKARLGYINPGVYLYSKEWDQVLPDGIVWAHVSVGVRTLTAEGFKPAFEKWSWAGETLANRKIDYMVCGGTPVQLTLGYEKSQEAARQIQEKTGVPTVLQIDTLTDALKKLSAKKIVMATPYTADRNEEHKKHLEKFGFEVLSVKGLEIKNNVDITMQPSYASYQLAREAYREAPQADAIWIGCPAWPVLANVATLERDTGKPVITDVTAILWAALTKLGIKGAIKGYGKLLETL